jgi:hypothetical protein
MSASKNNTRLTETILDNIVEDRKDFLELQKSEFSLKDLESRFFAFV